MSSIGTCAALAAAILAFTADARAQSWGPGADDKAFAEMLRTGFRNAGPVSVDRGGSRRTIRRPSARIPPWPTAPRARSAPSSSKSRT